MLPLCGSGLGGGEVANLLADISPATVQKQVGEFLATRLNDLRHVRDAMAESQDQQKQQADAKNRVCIEHNQIGEPSITQCKKPTYICSVRCL